MPSDLAFKGHPEVVSYPVAEDPSSSEVKLLLYVFCHTMVLYCPSRWSVRGRAWKLTSLSTFPPLLVGTTFHLLYIFMYQRGLLSFDEYFSYHVPGTYEVSAGRRPAHIARVVTHCPAISVWPQLFVFLRIARNNRFVTARTVSPLTCEK